jgi:copper chaperone CopZ
MTKTYQIHGAGCNNCLRKITNTLINLPEVKSVKNVDLDSIIIKFKDYLEYIDIDELNLAFENTRFYLTKVPHIINFELVEVIKPNIIKLY